MVNEGNMPHQTIFYKAGFVGVLNFFGSSEIAFMQPFHSFSFSWEFLEILNYNLNELRCCR